MLAKLNSKMIFITAYICFIASLLTGFLNGNYTYQISSLLFIAMFLLILCGCFFHCKYEGESRTGLEIIAVLGILTTFWLVEFTKNTVEPRNDKIALIGCVSLVASVTMMFNRYLGRCWTHIKSKIINFSKKDLGIVIILAAFALLSVQDFDIWVRGDSYYYYNSVAQGKNAWDFSLNDISSFTMGMHTTYAYAILLYIGEYVLPDTAYGVRIVNLIMAELTIYCFYKIVRMLYEKMGKISAVALTACFAFAPLFLGISYQISSDFALLCFFVWFVYADIRNFQVWKWFAAMAVCFSKETGVIVLVGYYFGEIIKAFLNNQKRTPNVFFQIALKPSRVLIYSGMFLYLIPAFLYEGGWATELRTLLTGEATEDEGLPNLIIRWHYYVYKALEWFVMHFMWVIIVLGVVALLIWLIKGRHKKHPYCKRTTIVLPLAFSWIFYAAVSMWYFTYVMYRYNQIHLFFMILLLGFVVSKITSICKIQCLLFNIVAAIFLVESYVTLDPLTFATFPNVDAGNGTVVSTRRYFDGGAPYYPYHWLEDNGEVIAEHYLSEGLEHNRSIILLQYALEEAFEYMNYSEDKLLILDNFGGWIESDCHQLFGMYVADAYYWNDEENTIKKYGNGEYINLTIYESIGNKYELFRNYDEIYYLDVTFNPYREDEIYDKYNVSESQTIIKGPWRLVISKLSK